MITYLGVPIRFDADPPSVILVAPRYCRMIQSEIVHEQLAAKRKVQKRSRKRARR